VRVCVTDSALNKVECARFVVSRVVILLRAQLVGLKRLAPYKDQKCERVYASLVVDHRHLPRTADLKRTNWKWKKAQWENELAHKRKVRVGVGVLCRVLMTSHSKPTTTRAQRRRSARSADAYVHQACMCVYDRCLRAQAKAEKKKARKKLNLAASGGANSTL
jgi:hypothetical protein